MDLTKEVPIWATLIIITIAFFSGYIACYIRQCKLKEEEEQKYWKENIEKRLIHLEYDNKKQENKL